MNRLETLLEKTYFSDKLDLKQIDDLRLNDADFKLMTIGNFVFYKITGTNWHIMPFDLSDYRGPDTLFCIHVMCQGMVIDIVHDAYSDNKLHEIIHLSIPEIFALEEYFLNGNFSASLMLKDMNIKLKGDD